MHEASSAWLSYALALHQLHKADAKGHAQRALEQGMSASPAPQVVPQTPYEVLLHDICSILLCLTSLLWPHLVCDIMCDIAICSTIALVCVLAYHTAWKLNDAVSRSSCCC